MTAELEKVVKERDVAQAAFEHWLDVAYRYEITLAELRAALDVLGGASAHGHDHVYLSTSCRHAITDGRPELHDDCQVTAPRHDGSTKVGAKCKHCTSVCVCPVCRHPEPSDG